MWKHWRIVCLLPWSWHYVRKTTWLINKSESASSSLSKQRAFWVQELELHFAQHWLVRGWSGRAFANSRNVIGCTCSNYCKSCYVAFYDSGKEWTHWRIFISLIKPITSLLTIAAVWNIDRKKLHILSIDSLIFFIYFALLWLRCSRLNLCSRCNDVIVS